MVSKLPKGEGSAAWLLDYLLGQTLEGYERSIKLTMGEVLDRRYLGGVAFNRVQRKGVLEICRRLDIPRPLVDLMSAEAEDPDVVHFGYEGAPQHDIFKVYFEYAQRARNAGCDADYVLHRAFKWDARRPERHTVATYRCIAGLDSVGQRRRISGLLGRTEFAAMMGRILDLTHARCPAIPMYLEVSEEGNFRSSFDLNVHDSDLSIAAIHPVLGKYFLPRRDLIDRALAHLGTCRVGHLSAGRSRDGLDFLTIYYDPFA